MAKESVTVDGVTLTRKQVEEAFRKLNDPEPERYIPRTGDTFTLAATGKLHYIAMRECDAIAIAKGYNYSPNSINENLWAVNMMNGYVHLFNKANNTFHRVAKEHR